MDLFYFTPKKIKNKEQTLLFSIEDFFILL